MNLCLVFLSTRSHWFLGQLRLCFQNYGLEPMKIKIIFFNQTKSAFIKIMDFLWLKILPIQMDLKFVIKTKITRSLSLLWKKIYLLFSAYDSFFSRFFFFVIAAAHLENMDFSFVKIIRRYPFFSGYQVMLHFPIIRCLKFWFLIDLNKNVRLH